MTMARDPVWLDENEVVAISVLSVALFGGLSGDVRNDSLLKAAVGRPLNQWHYDAVKPDLFTLAAAYCFALVRGNAFLDGNTRTACIVAVVFLELNGVSCTPDQADIVQTMHGAAKGSLSEDDLAEWFRANSTA
jgi:death on curing protein